MRKFTEMSTRQRLVFHVHELERLQVVREQAAEHVKEALGFAQADGFDATTLRVVLKLRKMTPDQRRERRALEAIYLAALEMLDGDSLPDEARRRLDSPTQAGQDRSTDATPNAAQPNDSAATNATEQQPTLALKTPDEARAEGAAAAEAGKRVYDNPYPAGDPCRAAWDEGWCAQQNAHGMETPAAYQRRSTKPPEKDEKPDESSDSKRGAA